jgi:CRISPR-associated protein Cas2
VVIDMYVVLIYDITMDTNGQKVHRNVFKTCKKYLTHIQKSVFEGNLTQLKLMQLKTDLDKHIRKDIDSVIIFRSREERWLDKEFWGVEDEKTDRFF